MTLPKISERIKKLGKGANCFMNLFEKRLTGLFLFGSISHSFFSHFNSACQIVLIRKRMAFCLVQQMHMFKQPVLLPESNSAMISEIKCPATLQIRRTRFLVIH